MPIIYSSKHSYSHKRIIWNEWENHENLNSTDIHIWRIDVRRHFHDLFRMNRHLLTHEDHDKAKRFYWADDYKNFITGRILLRILFGRYLSVPPSNASFSRDKGKPFITNSPLKFNLSYAHDHLLISFGLCETGIDAEYIQPSFDFQEILTNCFSNQEISFVTKEKQSSEQFFLQWTRKEALLKYTGQGIIDDLKIVPSLDGHHKADGKKLKIDTDINLLSFNFQPNYVGTLAYPQGIENIIFLEWQA